MPAILIHGVPDSHHVWDGVRQHLTRTDVEAWDLPGFGAPRPNGFGSSKEEYVDWLIRRLERVRRAGGPGRPRLGLHPHPPRRLLRPDLVRTWAGGNGPVDSAYVWHPLAKIWQDQVEGDRFMRELRPEPFAQDLAAGFDVPIRLAKRWRAAWTSR
ncbi:alpha/beta fold hydrolase [Streptomyces sp. KL116D]|uniref:alpha/beta fold hydrolase n=1 Tax=Streptomyces sp. KL116D TaxID=3045152 RepID=UPI003557A309